jgi:nitrogen fixation protein FixH
MTVRHDGIISNGGSGGLTGRRFLFLLLAAFAIVFGVNGLLIYKALSTFDGIEVDDAYQRGRAYNRTLEAMATQTARGWRATIRVTPSGHQGAALHAVRVAVTLTDRSGVPVRDVNMHATFWRPVSVGVDRRFAMPEVAPGLYRGDVQLSCGGNWVLRLAGVDLKGEKFAQEQRILISN